MKKTSLLLFACVVCTIAFAQSRYVFINYKDAQKPGLIADLPFPEKIISDAIKDKLEKSGYKGKESKGFEMYKGVKLAALGSESYDLYFKVDRKGKKDNETSTVTMLLSRGLENFISEADDAKTISNAKSWLDSLQTTAFSYDLELQIKEQGNIVEKAEKKYRNLVNDGDDMQQKKKKLENQIEENQKDQKNQQTEIDKQKQIFSTLRDKRRG